MKKINIFDGILSTLKTSVEGNPYRNDVFNEEWENTIIDTCVAFDVKEWETGISNNNGEDWIIVEQYEDRETAEAGHKKWIESMKDNPSQELKDIGVWDI